MAIQETKVGPIPISGLAHIGIRVHDLERSVRFYELLGFTKTAGPIGPEPVAILDHPSGVEVNLVLNATNANEPNVLMDVPEKHPGITHFALLCPDIMAAKERLEAAGIPLSGGPVRFGPGAQGTPWSIAGSRRGSAGSESMPMTATCTFFAKTTPAGIGRLPRTRAPPADLAEGRRRD